MVYINIKCPYEKTVETLDQFDTRKEAKQALKDYRVASDYYNGAYLSSRATKDWNNN